MAFNLKKGIKAFVGEYRQVKWPTPKTTINLSLFVLVIAIIVTALILIVDTFFFEIRSTFIFNN